MVPALISGCGIYSFSGAALSPEIKTVTVQTFPNEANLVVPGLGQKFSEKMKDKFLRETQLKVVPEGGDIEFDGAITEYRLDQTAVQSNEKAGLSRLVMSVRINYTNNTDPKANFERRFSSYTDFDSSKNLSDVEDDLIETLSDQLITDIFNATVNNW